MEGMRYPKDNGHFPTVFSLCGAELTLEHCHTFVQASCICYCGAIDVCSAEERILYVTLLMYFHGGFGLLYVYVHVYCNRNVYKVEADAIQNHQFGSFSRCCSECP